jgi:hypothetical protein
MTGHQRQHRPPPGKRPAPHRAPAGKSRPASPLQRAVGNSAVGDAPAVPFPLPVGPVPTPPKAYTLDLVIDGKERNHPNLAAAQARERLLYYWRECQQDLDLYRKLHQELIDQRREHYVAGYWSEHLGRVELPDIEMWNEIGRGSLAQARDALSSPDAVLHRQWEENEATIDRHLPAALRNNPMMQQALAFDADLMRIERATAALERGSNDLRDAWRRIEVYQGGVERGAGRAITGIKVTIAVLGAAASGGGTTFAGQGAGLVARSATSALTAGGIGTVTEVFTQYGEIRIGARTEFDVGGIVKRGVADTVLGFVGGVAGGKFAGALKGSVARWVTGLSKAQMAAFGLTEQEILSRTTSAVLEWAAGVGVTPLTTATGAVMHRALNGEWEIHNFDEFAAHVFDDMITNAVTSAAMISAEHAFTTAPRGGGGGSTSSGSSGGGSSGGGSSGGQARASPSAGGGGRR